VSAFLWNVSPLVALVVLLFAWVWYGSFARGVRVVSRNQNAIEDAPAIHLGQPFVKKVGSPNSGVTLFLHVPFTVTREVRSLSLNILAELERFDRYSPNANCNDGYNVPPYGFHVVDREYDEPPLPSYVSGTKVVSERLQPGRTYYLLREVHFGGSQCTVEDYRDFDATRLKATLNTSRALDELKKRPGQ
jgi:hypothetical protein